MNKLTHSTNFLPALFKHPDLIRDAAITQLPDPQAEIYTILFVGSVRCV